MGLKRRRVLRAHLQGRQAEPTLPIDTLVPFALGHGFLRSLAENETAPPDALTQSHTLQARVGPRAAPQQGRCDLNTLELVEGQSWDRTHSSWLLMEKKSLPRTR